MSVDVPISHINQTKNLSASAMTLQCFGAKDVFIALCIVIIMFITIVGNCFVILAVCLYGKMRTFTNWLLVSLASADFLVGMLIMPLAMIYLIYGHWTFGFLVCRVWATLDTLLCTASILSLCVISVDRYFAITSPLKYIRRRRKTLCVMLILCVWSMSLLICVPPWFIPTWGFLPDDDQCMYASTLSYRIYSACGSFYIPLFVMVFVYYRVLKIAGNRAAAFAAVTDATGSSTRFHAGGYNAACATPRCSRPSIPLLHSISRERNNSIELDIAPVAKTNGDAFGDLPQVKTRPNAVLRVRYLRQASRSSILNYENSCEKPTYLAREETAACKIRMPSMSAEESSSANELDRIHPDPEIQPSSVRSQKTAPNQPSSLLNTAHQYYTGNRTHKAKCEKAIYFREQKALKTVGVIMAGFVLCWVPFFVIYLIQSACTVCEVPDTVFDLFLWLGYSNSACNPLIYVFYNTDFRRCFKDILGCGCCKHRAKRSFSVRKLHMKSRV